MRIDLHAHSSVSDGTDSPAELVVAAAAAGLDVVALTDHDTTAGWSEAAAALPDGMRLVRGAEFSCVDTGPNGSVVSVHLLGYLFDPDAGAITAEQARLHGERRDRLHAMAVRMAADGFPVDPDALIAGLAPDTPAGRPHLARVLVRAGVVDSVGDAFARFLSNDGPYYTGRADTDVHTAIRMIRDAGGVPVLAHGLTRKRGRTLDPDAIRALAATGLLGVEVDHPDHTPADREILRDLAAGLGLLVTGSSDYHGANKVNRLGQERTSAEQFERLAAAASGVRVLG